MSTNNNLGETLAEIEDVQTCRGARYARIEQAIERASFEDIKLYYARLHKIPSSQVCTDPRFPFHPNFKFGDATACCEDCVDLEMAILVNIPFSTQTLQTLGKWFPTLA